MSSKAETTKIEAELKLLRSALDALTDTRLRDVIENRIKECGVHLRRLQELLREKSKIQKKMDAIHLDNELYWQRGEAATLEERAAYGRRLERLDQIRADLPQRRSS
jgi:hypothetical protein